MANVKRCVQCGLLKDEEQFRKYTYSKTKDTKGRYRLCRACESINSNYRRAKLWVAENLSDGHIHFKQDAVLREKMLGIVEQTEKLYKVLERRGLRIPAPIAIKEQEDSAFTAIDSLLTFYKDTAPLKPAVVIPSEIPEELAAWLEADFHEWKDCNISPEYLQETIYESLKAKYRPQIGVDKDTYLPIYDDTYKDILNKILRRFDDYEEEVTTENEAGTDT